MSIINAASDLSLVVASVWIDETKSRSHYAGGDDGGTVAAGRKTTWTLVAHSGSVKHKPLAQVFWVGLVLDSNWFSCCSVCFGSDRFGCRVVWRDALVYTLVVASW